MSYRIFVINPGSTSTKIAYFEDENKIYECNVFHDAPELARFPAINDQLEYRKKLVLEFTREHHIDLNGIDAIVGRGGSTYPCESGVYEITDLLLKDSREAKSGVQHPANLGPQLAREMQKIYGGRAFIVDSPMTDEFQDLAHITGLAAMNRYSHLHALNLKATVRVHCKEKGIRYEDGNFIVCHIDGGMSVTAHKKGRMIDGNDAAGGEGPFTPTRVGSIDVLDFIDYLRKNLPEGSGDDHLLKQTDVEEWLKKIRKNCTAQGGLSGYFGTSNADTIHEMVESGDERAELVWKAMIYNICKHIGSMAAVLDGQVDAIVCGGGLLRFDDIKEGIEKKCGWIAPVSFYPGEFEHEAMAAGAIRVLKGEEQLKVYTGEPAKKYGC